MEEVPLDLKSEFVAALMSKRYSDSLKLCQIMLKFDPGHKMALEYLPILIKMVEKQATVVESEERFVLKFEQ